MADQSPHADDARELRRIAEQYLALADGALAREDALVPVRGRGQGTELAPPGRCRAPD